MGELSDRLIAELVDAVRAQLRKEAERPAARRLPDRRHREGHRARAASSGCASSRTTTTGRSRSSSTAPAATSPTASPFTTPSATSSAAASRSRSSCRAWPTRWARSCCRRRATGRRLAFPHSWIMIHEPAKWAGWQSTTRRGAASRAAQADAGSDLQDPVVALGQAAAPDHPATPSAPTSISTRRARSSTG